MVIHHIPFYFLSYLFAVSQKKVSSTLLCPNFTSVPCLLSIQYCWENYTIKNIFFQILLNALWILAIPSTHGLLELEYHIHSHVSKTFHFLYILPIQTHNPSYLSLNITKPNNLTFIHINSSFPLLQTSLTWKLASANFRLNLELESRAVTSANGNQN